MEVFNEVMILATVLSPIITGAVQVIKESFTIKKNFIPLASVVVGLLLGAAAAPFTDIDLVLRLWAGGLAGLAGTGLFELFKPRQGVSK